MSNSHPSMSSQSPKAAEAEQSPQPDTVAQTTEVAQHGDALIEAEEAESFYDEADSALGSDAGSETTSLKSSVLNFIQENGRRYHALKSGTYFLPNDEAELDRLDLFHHCLTLRTDEKLYLAPIGDNPQRILDLGTGTGIWAIEMGDMFPSAEILGNDLSPVQPGLVPPNVSFEADDMEEEWIYSSKFDYIHARYLAGSIKDWPKLLQQAYEHCKPGGWVEIQDFDMKFYTTNGDFRKGCAAAVWAETVASGIQAMGLEPHPGENLEKWFKELPFINIQHHLFPIPIGAWPKDRNLKQVGTLDQMQFLDGLEAISMRVFTNAKGWQPDEVRIFCAQVRKDMLNSRMQMQHDYHVVYGQKPFESED